MCSGTKLMPTQIPIQNDNCPPCRDEREEATTASRASSVRSLLPPLGCLSGRSIRLLSASSTAQNRRNDGLFNDPYGRDRLNGVVADTAFHDLPGTEPQHFDFGSLERSTRKNDVGRFNLGKIAHGDLSRSLRVASDRKPSFRWRILIRSAPHSHQATAWR